MGGTQRSTSTILDEATATVADREAKYGSPVKNFATIAELWSGYINAKHGAGYASGHPFQLTPQDVGMMMVLLKVARGASGELTHDTLVDIAGFARCAEMVQP